MLNWREEELERLRREYNFYEGTEIKDEATGGLRSQTLKLIIDYHERMLGIKFWGDDLINQDGDSEGDQGTDCGVREGQGVPP